MANNEESVLIREDEIEQAFKPLVGLPLSDMWRFGGWQRFEFGPQKPCLNRKGEAITRTEYALHVACDWRITGSNGSIVGSSDYDPERERRDEHARSFFQLLAESPPLVVSVKADDKGRLTLTMTGGYALEMTPTDPIQDEQWLFLLPEQGSFRLDTHGFGS